jgi:acyl carrier protein
MGVAMTSCDKLRNEKVASAGEENTAVGQRDATVVARVKKEIGGILGKSPGSISVTDQFIRDLGADSLDTVEIVMAIEEVFNISIADADAEKLIAVGDLIDYVTAKMKSLPVETGENDLGEKRDQLSKLFYRGHDLITQMRLAEENREAGNAEALLAMRDELGLGIRL